MNDSSFDIKFVDWLIVWLIDWLLVTLIITWLAHNMPATLQHNTATLQHSNMPATLLLACVELIKQWLKLLAINQSCAR